MPENESSRTETETTTFMRLFQYYPDGGGAEQHIDLGLLTLCCGSDSGLEAVEHGPDASRWIATQKPVVLIGRMAAMLLQRKVRAGRHRVASNPNGRLSLVLALRPCLRTPVELLDPESGDGPKSISVREYWAKTTKAGYNVNAKKDLREKQREESKVKRDQRFVVASV